jgi:hypothetical protein
MSILNRFLNNSLPRLNGVSLGVVQVDRHSLDISTVLDVVHNPHGKLGHDLLAELVDQHLADKVDDDTYDLDVNDLADYRFGWPPITRPHWAPVDI